MSCLVPCYNPIPPRAWSRVQNPCTFENELIAEKNVLLQYNKGNILQYKKNDSNMSKNQKYAQIAKGLWKTRNITWANQNVNTTKSLFTNPNSGSLKRVNYKKIYLASGLPAPIDAPLTCPNDYVNVPYDTIVIADGGNLVCGTLENICTGEVIVKERKSNCNPSSNSDVPGPIVPLCWNDGLATWYPKPRRVMSNSGNKFPQGYKGFISALNHCDFPWV